MNTKILVFVICVEAIIYLLLYNLHNCTFNKAGFTSFYQSQKTADLLTFTKEILKGKLHFLCNEVFL